MERSPTARRIEHGGRCDCELLAGATHVGPSVISFDYCRRVLQVHWRMTCRHGGPQAKERSLETQRWRDLGPTDGVKAILISNSTSGE